MARPLPTWVIPVCDGSEPVRVTIRDAVVPPCVHVDLGMPGRLFTPLEACNIGLALTDASKVAGQLGAAQGNKRKAKRP